VPQHVWAYTFAGDLRLGERGDFATLLLRPELRYDRSSAPFFSRENQFRTRNFRTRNDQATAAVGLVAYFQIGRQRHPDGSVTALRAAEPPGRTRRWTWRRGRRALSRRDVR